MKLTKEQKTYINNALNKLSGEIAGVFSVRTVKVPFPVLSKYLKSATGNDQTITLYRGYESNSINVTVRIPVTVIPEATEFFKNAAANEEKERILIGKVEQFRTNMVWSGGDAKEVLNNLNTFIEGIRKELKNEVK